MRPRMRRSAAAQLAASAEYNPPKVSIISNKTRYTLDWNWILTEQEAAIGFIIPDKKMKFRIEGEQFSLDCTFISHTTSSPYDSYSSNQQYNRGCMMSLTLTKVRDDAIQSKSTVGVELDYQQGRQGVPKSQHQSFLGLIKSVSAVSKVK